MLSHTHATCNALQAGISKLGEAWLNEHYNGTNIKFSIIYPGNVRTDIARKGIAGRS